jgi:hypothetical protein
MALDKYRIKSPTIALFLERGHHVAHLVPAGSVISVDSKTFDGDKLIGVQWAQKHVRARGEKVS